MFANGMGAAADMMAMMIIGCGVYSFVLNFIALVYTIGSPANRASVAFAGMAIVALVGTVVLLFLPTAGAILCIVAVPLVLTTLNFLYCRRRYRRANSISPVSPDKHSRDCAIAMGIIVLMIPLSCLLMNPVLYMLTYLEHGRGPVNMNRDDIVIGTTKEAIEQRYGKPHSNSERDGLESWTYYNGGIGGQIIKIEFDKSGKVESTWILD